MAIDWDALLNTAPGVAEQDDDPAVAKPIGVPKSFLAPGRELSGPISPGQAERRAMTTHAQQAPRYFDGAEAAPGILSPERKAQLQRMLAQAGLIKPNAVFRLGVWDDTSRKAYKEVLEHANYRGIDADTALNELLASPALKGDGTAVGGDGSGGGLAPEPGNVSRTTNPLTIEQQVQQVAHERLGRKLKASEVAKFAALYQGMEKSYNAKMNSAQEAVSAGADATIEEQAPVGAAADQFIDANYANEAGGQDAYGYLGALKNLLGG